MVSSGWQDYELIDSGDGMKLERYGRYRIVRPEAEAVWQPALGKQEWEDIHARFKPSNEENGGHWEYVKPIEPRWQMHYHGLGFWVQTTASRHVGVFPEQSAQWDWISEQILSAPSPINVLNLFGYTGLASLAAARAGAKVTHLDASRKVILWGQENQKLSGLSDRPIRWIIDDAQKFVQREIRRGNRYDAIILDPPKFGRGPKGEIWEFYKLLPDLLNSCGKLLTVHPRFMLLTAYAVKASALTIKTALDEIMKPWQGETQCGEIVLLEKSAGRYLSMAVYAAWTSK